jgi:2-amino-4-hydroxy-6-hydroxymethyldihydropteridine diphosphokinase
MMDAMDGSELAYIGLGANVGAARVAMVQAVAALAAQPQCSLEAVSPLYRTRPVGPVVQSDFLNAAAALRVPGRDEPTQGAMQLLVALKQIEGVVGRQERERWGPREIDLDLLLFGNHQLRVERDAAARSEDPTRTAVQWLEVPHPSASERLFVLAPLADLAPRLEPPGWGLSVAAARDRALEAEGLDAVCTIGAWDPAGGEWLDLTTA